MRAEHACYAIVALYLSRLRSSVLSCLLTCSVGAFGGCHFNTQPLFEAADAAVARAERGPGHDPDQQADDAGLSVGDASAPDAGVSRSPSAVSDTTGPACTPGQVVGCERDQLLMCAADGRGREHKDCGAAGCNVAAMRCNDCRPSALVCRDDKLTRCGEDGRPAHEQVCELGCSVPMQGEPACRICAPGVGMCKGSDLLRCAADGLSWETTKCKRGCSDGSQVCRETLLPTNIPKDACSWSDLSARERKVEGEVSLDLDRECPRVVDQGPNLPQLCVYAFERLRVEKGAVLRATGARALVLLTTGQMEIDGRISVSAKADRRGPGSVQAGPGVGNNAIGRVPDGTDVMMWTNLPANAGGGGGGFGTKGAPGGDGAGECGAAGRCAEGGAPGNAYGVDTLTPLQGGAAGGQNSSAEWSSRRSAPGAGGGALQLVACGGLKLGGSAVVDANGGGGQGGNPGSVEMDSDTPGGGSGGGSGGAILVQTSRLSVDKGAVVVANGGGGGGGASRTAQGAEPRVAGQPGQDGALSDMPASGGPGAGGSFAGGAGGANTAPVAGMRTSQRTLAAGGGGGAAGRVRIETFQGEPRPEGLLVSPSPSYGTVPVE